jgi:hypothetical protein
MLQQLWVIYKQHIVSTWLTNRSLQTVTLRCHFISNTLNIRIIYSTWYVQLYIQHDMFNMICFEISVHIGLHSIKGTFMNQNAIIQRHYNSNLWNACFFNKNLFIRSAIMSKLYFLCQKITYFCFLVLYTNFAEMRVL